MSSCITGPQSAHHVGLQRARAGFLTNAFLCRFRNTGPPAVLKTPVTKLGLRGTEGGGARSPDEEDVCDAVDEHRPVRSSGTRGSARGTGRRRRERQSTASADHRAQPPSPCAGPVPGRPCACRATQDGRRGLSAVCLGPKTTVSHTRPTTSVRHTARVGGWNYE